MPEGYGIPESWKFEISLIIEACSKSSLRS